MRFSYRYLFAAAVAFCLIATTADAGIFGKKLKRGVKACGNAATAYYAGQASPSCGTIPQYTYPAAPAYTQVRPTAQSATSAGPVSPPTPAKVNPIPAEPFGAGPAVEDIKPADITPKNWTPAEPAVASPPFPTGPEPEVPPIPTNPFTPDTPAPVPAPNIN